MAGLVTVFGSGVMTNSVPETENNDVLFIIGSNTKENHPIVALRMLKAVKKGAKLIVADPRRVPLVKHAHLWLKQRHGTDVALLNSMMHVMIKEGLVNKKFIEERTEGFTTAAAAVEEFTPEVGEKITGVPKEKIIEAARIYAAGKNAAIYYTMGITQHSHGTDNVYTLANLVLMAGNLGRESVGLNPLRGQNNVQGASDMACAPNVFPGYQKVIDKDARAKFEAEWKVNLSDKIGMTAIDMMYAADAGKLKALYIMGENPVMSDADQKHTIHALKSLDFLVVQDIFMTKTAELADVVLPAACFAEKDGTFTNTDRRVQRVRKAVNPPGDARDDSWIIMELSRAMGYEKSYGSMSEVFDEVGRLWKNVAGINYRRIEERGMQWPCPTTDHPGTPYMFKDTFPIGKAKFSAIKFNPSLELPDEEYPFTLSTGRQLLQYHTGTMTRRVKAIDKAAPEAYVEINPADAGRMSIDNGAMVRVTSRRGSITLKAKVTNVPDIGVVFIPFHYSEAAANVLTNPVYDPICKIPELKVCAVKLEKLQEDQNHAA